eukprot:Gregarina_sp_Poly_1__11515@NODE_998_length_5424_cov_493_643084_g700_i0_p1_GENE_NODE_998_length_5424_cov_493_643084_g700_i0NODE_998_length_5424_cov_493_643084_g700_i0_p1_ORF_typecomplete_len645_score70_05_NODE_998_length_5424_cov_493_643084_g700_i027864720
MRCVQAQGPAQPVEASSGVFQSFFVPLLIALRANTPSQLTSLWNRIEHKKQLDFNWELLRGIRDWDEYLSSEFWFWQSAYEPPDCPVLSQKEIASIVGKVCEITGQFEPWKCDLTRDASLFLGVLTEPGIQGEHGLKAWTAEIVNQLRRKMPTFLEWIESRGKLFVPANFRNYGTSVSFRYFIFEFLRRHPQVSATLSATFGWESRHPTLDMWRVWREKLNGDAKEPILKKFKDALTNSTTPKANSEQTISMNKLKLFLAMLKATSTKYWKPRIMLQWESILFKDKMCSDLDGPTPIKDVIPGNYRYFSDSRPRGKYETLNRVSAVLEDWYFSLWPRVFKTFNPQKWDSDEWLLILAIASVSWTKITGDRRWEAAAATHRPFWDFMSAMENKAISLRSPVLERAAFRYYALQSLSQVQSFEIEKFGSLRTSHLFKEMWDLTESIRCVATDKEAHLKSIGEFETVAEVITRGQFACLMETACNITNDILHDKGALRHNFGECVVQALNESTTGTTFAQKPQEPESTTALKKSESITAYPVAPNVSELENGTSFTPAVNESLLPTGTASAQLLNESVATTGVRPLDSALSPRTVMARNESEPNPGTSSSLEPVEVASNANTMSAEIPEWMDEVVDEIIKTRTFLMY